MTRKKAAGLAPEIASVRVDAGAAERWAWFLPVPPSAGASPEARLRTIRLRQAVAVPNVADVDAEARAIIADCTSASRKAPGRRVTLLLADLAREGAPLPNTVVEALATTLGVAPLHAHKRAAGVDWVDDETPLMVLAYLRDHKPDRNAALALFDSVLWYRGRGKVTPGRLVNALGANFGMIDPATGATTDSLDGAMAVADYVVQSLEAGEEERRRALVGLVNQWGHPRALRKRALETDEGKIAVDRAVVGAAFKVDRILSDSEKEEVRAKVPLDEMTGGLSMEDLLAAASPDEDFQDDVVEYERVVRPPARPSVREIADATGVPRSSVDRWLGDDAAVEHGRRQVVRDGEVREGLKGMRTDAFLAQAGDALARQRLRDRSGSDVQAEPVTLLSNSRLVRMQHLMDGLRPALEALSRDEALPPDQRAAARLLADEIAPVARRARP